MGIRYNNMIRGSIIWSMLHIFTSEILIMRTHSSSSQMITFVFLYQGWNIWNIFVSYHTNWYIINSALGNMNNYVNKNSYFLGRDIYFYFWYFSVMPTHKATQAANIGNNTLPMDGLSPYITFSRSWHWWHLWMCQRQLVAVSWSDNCMHAWWTIPNSKVYSANIGPIWGRQDPGGTHAGSINFAIGDVTLFAPFQVTLLGMRTL